jgi:hypothetical protein
MRHKWQDIDGAEVLVNANDGKTPLAFINEVDGAYYLKIPTFHINLDLKDTDGASKYETMQQAKEAGEEEVQFRINQLTSPAN